MQVKSAQYIFCGNRSYVLEEMLSHNLSVIICAVKGSYLEKYLKVKHIAYKCITNKNQLVKILDESEYDYFISNGCPYIIPVGLLKKGRRKFINIHPSYLPDLRGADPQPAALLFGRDSGATCHIMDDGIDTGDIISQVKIKYSEKYDINLLYQLTFDAEKTVFADAYEKKFKPIKKQRVLKRHIYYTFKKEDLVINLNCSVIEIVRRIKAFNNTNKGARLIYNKKEYRIMDAQIIENAIIKRFLNKHFENEIVFVNDNNIGIKKGNQLLMLKNIKGDCSRLKIGGIIS